MGALGKWDIGLEYNQAKTILENLINSHASLLMSILPSRLDRVAKKFIYFSIAYIQLTNGSRIGEALQILKEYVNTKRIEFKVMAEKTKILRPARIPPFIQKYLILYDVYRDLIEKTTINAVKKFIKRTLGWNTHALRYAFIRYAIEKGYQADTLALILGHKKIETTLSYSRNINAEKILSDLQG